ncbi:MAG: Crp/Fnr family transcriptional regulator [Candidatus Kapabacteria bacterium]|nr:Crp/Fnr family transcriptional regulator [Candidatus Kapabacteria bacterium]
MSEQVQTKEHIIATISRLYVPLSEECQRDLAVVSAVQECSKSTYLVKKGQLADRFYFIAHGAARAYYVKGSKNITAWFAFENQFINALDSYFRNIPSPHYIELLEQSLVWSVAKKDAILLAKKHRDFEALSNKIILSTLLSLNDHVVSLRFGTAKERYQSLLTSRHDITNRVPLHHIASYLGITMETLSRIRNQKHTSQSNSKKG